MMAIFTLAAKDLRLLIRDTRSAVILLLMPLLFVAILGVAVGEGFGQRPDDRLRISIVNLDRGIDPTKAAYPSRRWSEVVIDDLAGTADIRLEMIASEEEALKLLRAGKRAAVLIFDEHFSERMNACSFLTIADPPPINPLYRDGINVGKLGLRIERDPTQLAAASIIEQVAQVTLLRVVIPWMIGKAFERVGDPAFMDMMVAQLQYRAVQAEAVLEQSIAAIHSMLDQPIFPPTFSKSIGRMILLRTAPLEPKILVEISPVIDEALDVLFKDDEFVKLLASEVKLGFLRLTPELAKQLNPQFQKLIRKVFTDPQFAKKMASRVAFPDLMTTTVRHEVGPGVKEGIARLFSNYNFTAKTWAGLTRSEEREANDHNRSVYQEAEEGILKRGALRYQLLVPSYLVMFAFFLVLTVGWLFVAERKQGTLTRLRLAPVSRSTILLGKVLPCLLLSLFQGAFLLLAGKVIFGMSWGPEPLWLLPLILCTSLAATGMSILIAGIARTETQVAIYGTLLVLLLAGISGAFMPRYLMPEAMKQMSYVTPHAWALDAYLQLLTNPAPVWSVVREACGMLLAFAGGFFALAWWRIRLD